MKQLMPLILILTIFSIPFLSILLFLIKKKIINNCLVFFYGFYLIAVSIYTYDVQFHFDFDFVKFDALSSALGLLIGFTSIMFALFNQTLFASHSASIKSHLFFTVFSLVLIASLYGLSVSNNLALSWVFIEASTLSSSYLIYYSHTKSSLAAVWKYLFICSIGISLAFVGIILLSMSSPSSGEDLLLFDNLYANAKDMDKLWLKISYVFMFVGFGTKIGIAPMHAWMPDVYAESPSSVSAILSAILSSVVLIILFKLNIIMHKAGLASFSNQILLVGGLTSLLVSSAFIYTTNNYKRMYAYSSIESIGFISLCLYFGGFAIHAAYIQIFSNALSKLLIFFNSECLYKISNSKLINHTKGILSKNKIISGLLFIAVASIASLPPFPSFFAKFLLFKQMIASQSWYLIALCSMLFMMTSISLIKQLTTLLVPSNHEFNPVTVERGLIIPQIIIAIVLITLSFGYPSQFYNFIFKASLNYQENIGFITHE